MTQPPFSLMSPEREVFHICRLPHIFHFSISVDIGAAFIQLAGLILMLCPGPGNKPMQSPTAQILSHIGSSLLKALVVDCLGPELARTAWASPRPSLQSWGFRGWSCLPSEWSSSSSWQFSSSLASWSPCPHLKVRAHVRPLCLVTNTVPAVSTAVIYSTDIWWLIICIGLKNSVEWFQTGNNSLFLAHHDSGVNQWNWVVSHYRDKLVVQVWGLLVISLIFLVKIHHSTHLSDQVNKYKQNRSIVYTTCPCKVAQLT